MQTSEVLNDAFGRIQEAAHRTAAGLDADGLTFRPDPDANSIGWLLWHLTRVQDDHLSEVAGREQAWTQDGWHTRLGLALDPSETGFGHSSEQVAQVRIESPGPLLDYHDAVTERTRELLASLDSGDLDRIIDRSWDPPVSVGVRIVSVIGDCLEHVGQAQYVRGLYERRI